MSLHVSTCLYMSPISGSEERAGDVTSQYASLDDLASIVAHVRSALNITDMMVLLGVGAGANIGQLPFKSALYC